MQKKGLYFTPADNVAVALEALSAGDTIVCRDGVIQVVVTEDVPQGHKVAVSEIVKGSPIVKYGAVIGTALVDIQAGGHVHNYNIEDGVTSWGENTHFTFREGQIKELNDKLIINELPPLYGYRRADGKVGFRNHVLVVSTCVCANQPVKEVEFNDRDIVCIENPSGCLILTNEIERMENLLLGLARNPNVGAVLFVGLGCENISAKKLYEAIKDEKPAAYLVSQEDGSCEATTEKAIRISQEFKQILMDQKRERVDFSDIRVGTKCGGSDWTSAIASNPAIGYCSDLIVKNGGYSLQGETCGWFGAEENLVIRSRTEETAKTIISTMESIYAKCKANGKTIEKGNPTPGNIKGGISTLKEKAIGNIVKGGEAPIDGMLGVGEHPARSGMYLCDTAGIDPASLFELTAASANVLLFSTGRGTPTGTPIAPVIKLTASPTAMGSYASSMDVDLTDIVLQGTSIEEGGRRLLEKIIKVVNGELTISEKTRNREYVFPLIMGPM